ncbi:izumo sperm-egg fusion protein 4 isoform X6 [Equus quagga]|uniref:izumo sperm-egg fusion protein 4 isoform X6 n=1 Tax=Equus quagga TaxID=89248 RepID=UPI001EE246D8|nr:izumo sperm-egg fusion protein 4 isoform X6 [Equus quagga]
MRGARPEGGVEPWVQFPLGVAARGRDLGAEPEPSVIFCWGGAWGRGGRRWLVGARRGAWHRALLVGWRRRGVAKGHRWLVSARGGAWRGGAVGWSWCAGAMGGRGGGGGMALLLCLSLTVALARGCLHCHSNFSDKFNFYRDHVNLKSWWVGDIPVSGSLLTDWSQDTMNELHLAIPAEITREKLDQVANAVYQKMDVLYQGKMYFPGYFPNELRNIFREQAASIVSVTVVSAPLSRPWGMVAVAAWGPGGRGEPAAACRVLQASSSTRPSPAATAQTRTSSALATIASRRRNGRWLCRVSSVT